MTISKPIDALSAREAAFRVLRAREESGDFTEDSLNQIDRTSSVATLDRALLQELCYGVVRWEGTLDWLIHQKAPGRQQKLALQILLRLGLYQLFWLERIPDHAAVHETVELAKRLGYGPQAGFVNAVLRGYLRERQAVRDSLEVLKEQNPALGFSHPEWLYQRWEARWGREKAIALMAWNNQPPPTYARINTLRVSPMDLTTRWTVEGVQWEPVHVPWVDSGFVLKLISHPPFNDLASFQEGLFYIQDPSTLLAPIELAPGKGCAILDLCAAPGGKTTYLAQIVHNQAVIVAEDINAERLNLVKLNCARLGAACVQMAVRGGPSTERRAFDLILVDAPCSNTGVMRRRVDVRWRVQPAELTRLRTTQLTLLATAADKLKRGGAIAYSTCSLEAEENERVVQDFLANYPDFILENEVSVFPLRDGFDGAYVALLRKGVV